MNAKEINCAHKNTATKTSTSRRVPHAHSRRGMALFLLLIGFLLGVDFWFRTATVPWWLVALSFAGPLAYIVTETVIEAIRIPKGGATTSN